jgi:hypothetical protein
MTALPIDPSDDDLGRVYMDAYAERGPGNGAIDAARRALFQAGVEAERARAAAEHTTDEQPDCECRTCTRLNLVNTKVHQLEPIEARQAASSLRSYWGTGTPTERTVLAKLDAQGQVQS